MIKTCFDGRYVLILMGLFSMYTGLLYNECFSIPIDLFGSNWQYATSTNSTVIKATRIDANRAYPFGVDPAWKGSSNILSFYNSLKMKMSVIFGVTQMCVGIFMSLLNGLHFKNPVNIFCEFVPQILFMLSIFGYMCFLILFKWSNAWQSQTPPFLLNVMIQMFLSPFGVADENKLFNGQVSLIKLLWLTFYRPVFKSSLLSLPLFAFHGCFLLSLTS
jgi:V-type H+-transporting ATPase subunit a